MTNTAKQLPELPGRCFVCIVCEVQNAALFVRMYQCPKNAIFYCSMSMAKGEKMSKRDLHCLPNIAFMPFETEYHAAVIDIYNGYILSGTAAFPPEPVPLDFFHFLLDMPECYPVYILLDTLYNRVVGFCFLSPFHSMPTFQKTAIIDYFITPEYTGKGLGSLCLQRLEKDARKAGIVHIIAEISSENHGSIAFHQKHGFRYCGSLEHIGNKLGRDFDVAFFQKDLSQQ